MTKQTEALKLALKQAFDLGQTYWSWADSEYQSHWKKADAAKERFSQLVEDTISKALTEQQTDWEAVAADQAMTIALLRAEQPAQQEPVAWLEILRNNKTSSDEVIGAFLRGHAEYLTGEAFVITSPPAQRKPLTDEEILALAGDHYNPHQRAEISFARAIEAKIKEKNT